MSRTTHSILSVARKALAVGREAFDDYAHPNSPKKFTQPQLFACLAVRQTLNVGYEAMRVRLDEWSDLRDALGLDRTPGSSTLHDAERRLVKMGTPTFFSMLKRKLGSVLKARNRHAIDRECHLRAIALNPMILAETAGSG